MPRRHEYWVYIATNRTKTLYTGVTNDIARRMYEHKNSLFPGFTSKYRIDRLVYFETTTNVLDAIAREKQIKRLRRSKKIALIEARNPKWEDFIEKWNTAGAGSSSQRSSE
ncbi:MAG TPA: GIY-YIG nuclease family protein [Thermoanaerobaculia bacterium]|nr:GIY-YIG nuclease family protein [Thermoanaerobaculia bacterium]